MFTPEAGSCWSPLGDTDRLRPRVKASTSRTRQSSSSSRDCQETMASDTYHYLTTTDEFHGRNHRCHAAARPPNAPAYHDKKPLLKTATPTSCLTLFLLPLLLSMFSLPSASSTLLHNNQASPSQELAGQVFTCGKLYYRTFHLDQQRNVLYVGAM